MTNTAQTASNSVYGREKWFWYNKINLTVVQWPRSCWHVLIYRVRGDFAFCLFVAFFFLFNICFLILFFLLACFPFLLLLTLLINIYFKLKSGVLFWRRDFKSSWSAYWPNLRPEKTISCQDMSLLWNSWTFFNLSWHHDKQHTVHHKLY